MAGQQAIIELLGGGEPKAKPDEFAEGEEPDVGEEGGEDGGDRNLGKAPRCRCRV